MQLTNKGANIVRYSESENPLPGRLSECKCDCFTLEYSGGSHLLIMHFSIGSDCFICQYHIEDRLWDVDLDTHFCNIPNIPGVIEEGRITTMDALFIVAKVLTQSKTKKAACIRTIKKWRRILMIFPGHHISPAQPLLTFNT